MAAWMLLITSEGVATLQFDSADKKINKLTPKNMTELAACIAEIRNNADIRVLLIKSGKPNMFIAGADIAEIRNITSAAQGEQKARDGQHVFASLEALPIPTIAVIDGPALGGGLELALACRYRLVSDNTKTQLGLPEVSLGILPGFGGTQRLPRLVGVSAALDLILTGKMIDGRKAEMIGLADACYSSAFLNEKADLIAKDVAAGHPFVNRKLQGKCLETLSEKTPMGRFILFKLAKKQLMAKTKGRYPAPLLALDVVRDTYRQTAHDGYLVEAEAFGQLVITPEAKTLIQLFYTREDLKKYPGPAPKKAEKPIQSTAVVGAGLMGGGISWLLAHTGYTVRMKDISWEAILKGYESVKNIQKKLISRQKVTTHEADMATIRISGILDYSGFAKADLVIEAIVENMALKKSVFSELETVVSPTALLATNTSSLSITEMASDLKHPERFAGFHFFSPVHQMPLVEVIRGEKTSDHTVARLVELAIKLKKTPIVVKDGPGFLVNRILIPYVNEAVRLLAEGVPLPKIDALMEDFGMPLGPLSLADEVGLDIGYKVAKILEEGFGDRMQVSGLFEYLHQYPAMLGKKTRKGFYLYEDKKKRPNPDLAGTIQSYQAESGLKPATILDEDIVARMVLLMVNEAARCLEEGTVEKPAYLDMAMLMGTGFPVYRGGVCRYADAIGIDVVVETLHRYSDIYGARFEPARLLLEMNREHTPFYDYT